MDETQRLVLARIRGRVQGVGYRAWTVATARRYGLRGYVRNCASGEVEALFAGRAVAVEAMIEACFQGPNFSQVDAIDVDEIVGPRQNEYLPLQTFAIKPTR